MVVVVVVVEEKLVGTHFAFCFLSSFLFPLFNSTRWH